MSRMSERQREYLLCRVNDLVRNEKQGYELQLADKKEQMVKKLFPEFLKKVKLDKKLAKLKQTEDEYDKLLEDLKAVVNRMYKDQGKDTSWYNDNSYALIESKLRSLSVDVIEKEFKRTPEGEALLHLDEVHQEIQDYIWSAGSETEQLFKTIGHVLKSKANIQLGYNKIALPNK
tara:strand:+ start:218 stop:742 length:525 start_codon:yes stop_codon:yes gene_type:complete